VSPQPLAGSLTHNRSPARVAQLFAMLALQIAAGGAEAQASRQPRSCCFPAWSRQARRSTWALETLPALQASLAAHVARHAPAYAALLAPHQTDRHVSSLLHLLAAHGRLEAALPGVPETAAYLRLLAAVAARVAADSVDIAESVDSGSTPGSPAELLVSLVRSMVAAAASLERALHGEGAAGDAAAAAGSQGDTRGAGRPAAARPDWDARWAAAGHIFCHPCSHSQPTRVRHGFLRWLAAGGTCPRPTWPLLLRRHMLRSLGGT
jgi:hypothetical protein